MATAPANNLPLFYKDLVPLSSVDHADYHARSLDTAEFLVGQHVIHHLGEAGQAFALDLVLGLDVSDSAGDRRIAFLEDLIDHIFLGMMAGFRVLLEVLDDGLEDFVIGPFATVEHAEFTLDHTEELRNVAVLFVQQFNDS